MGDILTYYKRRDGHIFVSDSLDGAKRDANDPDITEVYVDSETGEFVTPQAAKAAKDKEDKA